MMKNIRIAVIYVGEPDGDAKDTIFISDTVEEGDMTDEALMLLAEAMVWDGAAIHGRAIITATIEIPEKPPIPVVRGTVVK
jgi:hypothetical protein